MGRGRRPAAASPAAARTTPTADGGRRARERDTFSPPAGRRPRAAGGRDRVGALHRAYANSPGTAASSSPTAAIRVPATTAWATTSCALLSMPHRGRPRLHREDDGRRRDPVLINAQMAQKMFGDADAIGQTIPEKLDPQARSGRRSAAQQKRVVGVIEEFRQHGEYSMPRARAVRSAPPRRAKTAAVPDRLLLRRAARHDGVVRAGARAAAAARGRRTGRSTWRRSSTCASEAAATT